MKQTETERRKHEMDCAAVVEEFSRGEGSQFFAITVMRRMVGGALCVFALVPHRKASASDADTDVKRQNTS